jgi:IS605 OrfB family transposase
LTVALKLLPSPEQAAVLETTLACANDAANVLSAIAWDQQTFAQFALHRLAYARVRAESNLTAQMVVRLISKVADAYKLDRKRRRVFRRLGSVAYDDRILRYHTDDVSIWTVGGRQRIRFVCSERQRALLASRQGESDLVLRDGAWYLYATINVIEPPESEVVDYLGVDLGLVNLAVDSDGTVYAGGQVSGLRRRHRRLRRTLQAKRTNSARRLLRKRKRHERRFATDVNHRISKRIVATVEGTARGIALENLGGIRKRVTARRPQRAALRSWAFFQLRSFIAYKAQRVGAPVVLVDPRNTSRTCPACGHVAKENRPAQSSFVCQSCGLAGLPDYFASLEIRRRALVNAPYASEHGVPPVV